MSATKKRGKQTVQFTDPPRIKAHAAIVGPKEGEGPLGNTFDKVIPDTLYGEKSWEKAEQKMLQEALEMAMSNAGLTPGNIDFLLAGDLLNQIISANYTATAMGIPFLGLYGACSTMFEGMALGSMLLDGGFAQNILVGASSHYDTAERQYRFPTEQGVQRPPTAQWTVTGAGSVVLSDSGTGPRITYATIGKALDYGVSDVSDMGAAMAPAAADTIIQHFSDTGRKPEDYDLIVTGDLATYGRALTKELVKKAGYDLGEIYTDCGILIYDPVQDTHAGGSGCGCSATVFTSYLLPEMKKGKYKKILGLGTGALLSPTATLQGESIPGIGHAVAIEM